MSFSSTLKATFRGVRRMIETIINFPLLLAVYFIGVGLSKALASMKGIRFLELSPDKSRKSYWRLIPAGRKDREGELKEPAYRQF